MGGAPQPFWPGENLGKNSGNKARKPARVTPGQIFGEVLLTIGAVLLLLSLIHISEPTRL